MSTPDDSAPPAHASNSDDLDPELINLRKPRAGIGPVLALSVVALAGYVMMLLLPDLGYWAGAKTPRDLGVAVTAGPLPSNTWVTLAGTPDRSFASRLRARQDIGRRLVPVLGSSRALWLELEGDGTAAAPAYDERYTGRLRRLDGLGFADELDEHVALQPPHPRFVDPARLGGALDVDLGGDRVAVTPDTPTEVEERLPDRARIMVIFTETLADEVRARAALTAALAADPGEPTTRLEGYLVWEVAGDPAALRARVGDAKLFAASVEPVFVIHAAAWKDVTAPAGDTATLTVAGKPLRRDTIVRASVLVTERIPSDALVLVVGDVPEAYWYVPIIFGALALLTLLTLWAFARTLGVGTRRRAQPATS